MKYLLDTCAISEFTKATPNSGVVQWLKSVDQDAMYISAVTVGEISKGIARLDDGKRKESLREWFRGDLRVRFDDKVIVLDAEVMSGWGEIMGVLEKKGVAVPVMDSLIAACVMAHDMTLVTKNGKDFNELGIRILNPWV